MSDPKRLIGGDDEIADALLRSAKGDEPGPAGRRRAAIAIGLAVGTAAGGAGTTAAAAGGLTFGSLVMKIVGVGVLVGAATVAVVEMRPAHTQAPVATTPTAAKEQAPAEPAASAPEAPSAAPTADDVPSAAPPPVRRAPPPRADVRPPPPPSASAPDPAPAASGLAQELAVLDRARSALDRGATDSALSELDAYARAFPNGALAPEATVIRLEALARRGSCDELRAKAQAFLASQPDAPQASRVRSLLESCRGK